MKMIKRFKRYWFGEIFEPDFSDYMKLAFVFLVIVVLPICLLTGIFIFFFDVQVTETPNEYYDYTTTKIEHYTKYDANGTTTCNLQTENGKKLTVEDVKVERQIDLPDSQHKLGSTTVVLQQPKVKKKFPGIVRFILKPANVNAVITDADNGIKPKLVITKYQYDD